MMHDSFTTALNDLARADDPACYGLTFVRLFPVAGAAV